MVHEIFHVEGMSCGHCVETIKSAVSGLSGVLEVEVDLEKKQVSVDYDEAQSGREKIASVITEAGFEVIGK